MDLEISHLPNFILSLLVARIMDREEEYQEIRTGRAANQEMDTRLESRKGGEREKTTTYVFDINIIVIQRHLDQYKSHFIYLFDRMNTL